MQVKNKTITGAKVILETLKKLGIDTIFGYPGGIVLKVYDEIYKQNDIKHILSRHEQASIHEAEGYARVSGKCGVALVTSGPGATNIITGLANAYMDGFPLIVFTGQVPKELIGKDAFQEIDIINIAKPCTKAVFQITDVNDLEKVIIKAYEKAMTGKKGPVLIDMSKNIFDESCEYQGISPLLKDEKEIPDNSIFEVIDLIRHSQRPLIISGGGIKHAKATEYLLNFAVKNNIPVVSSMMGLGTFPMEHPLYFGMIGIFGSNRANDAVKNSDLILSLGSRFNDRIQNCFTNNELDNKIIQVDINEKEIARFFRPKLALNTDINTFLNTLIKIDFPKFNTALNKNKTNNAIKNIQITTSQKLQSSQIVEAVYNKTKNMNIPITTEVGQHQLWVAKGYKFSYPEQFLTSGGSGTMGFGFPAAIGASIAIKKAPVICFTGDGSFQMNLHELATCVEYNIPIKIFILNNGYLGMVRQLQEKNCEGRYSETKISGPDFLKIAAAYGINAIRVEKAEEINNALDLAFNCNSPFLIDFITEPMEIV